MKRTSLLNSVSLALGLMLVTGAWASAQESPEGDPADVASIDAIMHAVYDVISGPAGGARDWDRFRSLFVPGAQLIPTTRGADPNGEVRIIRMSVEDWISRASQFFAQQGFFEAEIHRVRDEYGNIAHVFSTYESRRSQDEEPFVRGINSFQLMYGGDRWWVVNIFWADENLSGPIPQKYLPPS